MEVQIANTSSVTSKNAVRMGTRGLRSIATHGCINWLEDGREYRDFELGLHGALYGYTPSWWSDAIAKAARISQASSIAPADERIVAAMLGRFYPDIETVRFFSSGSEAMGAAARIACAATNREHILSQGYHGVDSRFAKAPNRPNLGDVDMSRGTLKSVRDRVTQLEWLGDYGNLSKFAAVFIETPPVDGGRYEAAKWLRKLFDDAHEAGCLTVLDEIVTGFRYGKSSAAGYYGVLGNVDLYGFGKTLSNGGLPISALAGREDLLNEFGKGVHYSNTFNANPICLAAAKVTLRQYTENPPWDYVHSIGQRLKEKWNELDLPWKLVGHPTRPIAESRNGEDFAPMYNHLFDRGFIFQSHPIYLCTAHTKDHVDDLVKAAKEWK